jgi:hypothetical protein
MSTAKISFRMSKEHLDVPKDRRPLSVFINGEKFGAIEPLDARGGIRWRLQYSIPGSTATHRMHFDSSRTARIAAHIFISRDIRMAKEAA